MNGRFLINRRDAKIMGVAAGLSDYTGIDPTMVRLGFIALTLLFDSPNNNFLLIALPDQPVFETIQQAEMMSNFWYNSADAISAQLEAARDGLAPIGTVRTNSLAGDGRFGGWVQALAGNVDRETTQSFGNTVFNTSYEQDYQGVQGGLDYQTGGTILGVSFGYGKSDADFDVSANRVRMDGYNLGAYAAFQSGGFFFNAIAKIDWVYAKSTPGQGIRAGTPATAKLKWSER
jgi:phage shock protein C